MTADSLGTADLQGQISSCIRCRDLGLLFQHEDGRWAYPILQKAPPATATLMAVLEAPNGSDTFDPDKGYLTFDYETDPSGRFTRELFESISVDPATVFFTNTVLCLPARKADRHPVSAKQGGLCREWLAQTITTVNPQVVITFGGKALHAVGSLERHGLILRTGAGKLHDWLGRKLLPLYHPGLLGRITRPADQQMHDISPLRSFLDARQ